MGGNGKILFFIKAIYVTRKELRSAASISHVRALLELPKRRVFLRRVQICFHIRINKGY